MKQALIAVQLETQFNELLRVARLLRNSGLFSVTFCFYDLTPLRFQRLKTISNLEHFNFLLFNQKESELVKKVYSVPVPLDQPVVLNPYSQKIRQWVKKNAHLLVAIKHHFGGFIHNIRCFMDEMKNCRLKLNLAKSLINKYHPDVIIVAEDGLGGPLELLKVAKDHHIPCVIYPYEFSTITQLIEGIINVDDYPSRYGMKNLTNRLIAKMFPQWRTNFNGQLLLRELSFKILAEEILGIAPRLPWVVHGGNADFLIVENNAMFRHYISMGIMPEKLVLLGALYDDILAEHLSKVEEYSAELTNSNMPKRRLLIALPPDHVDTSPDCDFRDYRALIDFWVDNLLSIKNVYTTFQAHPRVTAEQEQYMENKGIKLLRQDIATLIPYCDIFITSVSSVIRLAIAGNKIVLNYDVYKFGYQDYSDVEGVITFQEKDDFIRLINRLVTDDDFYDETLAKLGDYSRDWGMTDGLVAHRVLQFFTELTSS